MSVCEHDSFCSGAGWAHDAQITHEQRKELGLPSYGEISMAHAKRLMRAYRKGFGAGLEAADQLLRQQLVTVQETEDEDESE